MGLTDNGACKMNSEGGGGGSRAFTVNLTSPILASIAIWCSAPTMNQNFRKTEALWCGTAGLFLTYILSVVTLLRSKSAENEAFQVTCVWLCTNFRSELGQGSQTWPSTHTTRNFMLKCGHFAECGSCFFFSVTWNRRGWPEHPPHENNQEGVCQQKTISKVWNVDFWAYTTWQRPKKACPDMFSV